MSHDDLERVIFYETKFKNFAFYVRLIPSGLKTVEIGPQGRQGFPVAFFFGALFFAPGASAARWR